MIEKMDSSTIAQVLLSFIAALLTWRTWRFTIRPILHPNEPKELPYWIPFFGHAASFFQNFNAAISKGRKHFSPSQEPFAMIVAGQTMYVATSAEDINKVWRSTKAISMDPISMEMYVMAGIGKKSREALMHSFPDAKYNINNGKPLTPTQMVIEIHHQQLHNGPRLDALMDERIVPGLMKLLDFSTPKHPAVKARSGNSFSVSLYDLCISAFVVEDTDAYFGPKLRKIEPNMIKAFESWEQTNWKFLFSLPAPFARDMIAAKDTLTGAFTKYYKLPRSERPGSVFFVQALEDMLREVGLSEDEMARFTFLHYWAIIGNAYKLAFWLLAHLTADWALLEQIRQEVIPAVNSDFIDSEYLLEQCPKLGSLIDETLRLKVSSSLARVVMEPTTIGGKMLKPGNKVMLPISELHSDPEVWGTDPSKLHPERFLDNVKLAKSLSFRPWGGGQTLCAGRFMARRSVNAFVALLLSRYDIEVEPGAFPESDFTRPSPGVVLVSQGQDVMMKCTPRE